MTRETTPSGSASEETRREFLKTASAAAAGALVLPASSFAPQEKKVSQSPNETIGVGVIGVGGMGGGHCGALMRLNKKGQENLKILGVSDVCKPRLDSWVERCSKEQELEVAGYRNYRDLLERKDIDVVWVASPEHWHSQMSIDAIKAGKDVYVEKPMTLRLPDAVALHEVARTSKQIVQVGTQNMTDTKYQQAREWIAAGKIGKPVSSVTGYCRNSKKGEWNYYKVDPNVAPGEMLDWKAWCGPLGEQDFNTLIYHRWRRYKRYSTGIVGDLLVHMMTPLMYALDRGWPTRVVASGGHYIDKAMENHDQVNMTVEFEKEHTMVVWGSTCNEKGPTPMIRGYKANLHLGGQKCQLTPERIWAEDIDPEAFQASGSSHDRHRLDFLKCARDRKPAPSTVELGVKVMAAVDMATRSMWEGKAFVLDRKTMKARPA